MSRGHESRAPQRSAQGCHICSLEPDCLGWNLGAADAARLAALIQQPAPFPASHVLFRAGDPLKVLYAVRQGAFKLIAADEEGRERITRFVFAGELLGLDGVYAHRHSCTAMALVSSAVCVLPYTELTALMGATDALREQILRLANRDLEEKMALHANLSPDQRLARFLLDLAKRLSTGRAVAERFVLPMSRHDIGSYLGLATETVDHVFRRFAADTLAAFDGGEVRLLDRKRLLAIAGEVF